ncbi:Peptidase M1, membrane alanine aminopeptidase (fragment) [Candidatus Sulfopaludibacter sp. SbA3]
MVEDRTEGEWRITRRKTAAPIRLAGFNLGSYLHARVERAGYTVDVCANRSLERELKPRAELPPMTLGPDILRRKLPDPMTSGTPPVPSPAERLKQLADGVASALEFMSLRFGPPALPHLTVSPIPGTFGQGFPGLIYLSTLSYLKALPRSQAPVQESQELFFLELLQAHETAHQWWGNRVSAGSYRDNWLMESLANFSALLYLEKVRGTHATDVFLDSYRNALLEKNPGGQAVESSGPIVLGMRLESSTQPAAWRSITYGKGTWIMQMLRRRMGDERFLALLKEVLQRYDRSELTTEEFRQLAARFLPPNSPDPKLEAFFDQWVYSTGIPSLKFTYTVRGTAPALRLTGTLTQSDVDSDFSTLVPVEIRVAPGRTITQWVRSSSEPVTFTAPLKQAPLKVAMDPNHGVLRK